MIKYEQMRALFTLFKVWNYPSKHWSDHARWEIVESLHNVVMSAIKKAIMALNFIFIFANEMTTVDNQSWILVHYYGMTSWKKMPILTTFKHLEGGTIVNIKIMILVILITYGGFIVECVVCSRNLLKLQK